MPHERVCEQCGNQFIASRSDARFCSARCVAQFYRDNENPDYTHAEKQRVNWYTCDHCGQPFVVNDYAKREGKRTPRFCSNKCKQAAYRQRVSEQAARRSEQESRPGGVPPKGDKKQEGRQSAGSGYNQRKTPPHNHSAKWGKYSNPYEVLGVSKDASQAVIRKAWVKLCHTYHPDVNPDRIEWATEQMQLINRAYDELKRK